MKKAFKTTRGYIIGASIASVIVLSLNFSWPTLLLMAIVHPLMWTLLAYLVHKTDKKYDY